MPTAEGRTMPGGFVRRALAWGVDALLVLPVSVVMTWPWWAGHARTLLGDYRALKTVMDNWLVSAALQGIDPAVVVWSAIDNALLRTAARSLAHDLLISGGSLALVFAIVSGLLNVWTESRGGATPGKRALGLRVVDADVGHRVSVSRAIVRHLAGTLSWLSLNLGHLMAALPPDHAALHDRVARTRVIRVPSSRN